MATHVLGTAFQGTELHALLVLASPAALIGSLGLGRHL